MPKDAGTPSPRVTAASPSHGQKVAGPSMAGTTAVRTVWAATTSVVIRSFVRKGALRSRIPARSATRHVTTARPAIATAVPASERPTGPLARAERPSCTKVRL